MNIEFQRSSPSRTLPALGFIGVMAVLAAAVNASADVLTFDEIKKAEVQASFQTDCTATALPANYQQLPRVTTASKKFYLLYDPSGIETGKYGKFFEYPFWVAVIGANPPQWYSCSTQVFTQGAFLDHSEPAHFTIEAGGVVDQGTIELPIHSIAQKDFLDVTTSSTPALVDISQSAGIELQLRNLLPDTDLLVKPVVYIAPSHQAYWMPTKDVKLAIAGPEAEFIRVPPGDNPTVVRLTVEPKKLAALAATLTAFKPDSIHERVNLRIEYASDLGGVNRIRQATVLIRFVPSVLSLAFALIAGSLLGTLGAQLLPGTWRGSRALAVTALRGVVFSLIAELFAMLLVALGSKFVILQFELDPWQFLPVFFIGLAVSGGKDVFNYIGLQKQQAAAHP